MTWDQLSTWLHTFVPQAHLIAVSKQQPLCNHYPCLVSGFFQRASKLFLSERASWVQLKDFARRNAANALSLANMVMGMASILSSLNGWGENRCQAMFLCINNALVNDKLFFVNSALECKWANFANSWFSCPVLSLIRRWIILKKLLCPDTISVAFSPLNPSLTQAQLCCVLASADWLPAGFGRWCGCQATEHLLGFGWVDCALKTGDKVGEKIQPEAELSFLLLLSNTCRIFSHRLPQICPSTHMHVIKMNSSDKKQPLLLVSSYIL